MAQPGVGLCLGGGTTGHRDRRLADDGSLQSGDNCEAGRYWRIARVGLDGKVDCGNRYPGSAAVRPGTAGKSARIRVGSIPSRIAAISAKILEKVPSLEAISKIPIPPIQFVIFQCKLLPLRQAPTVQCLVVRGDPWVDAVFVPDAVDFFETLQEVGGRDVEEHRGLGSPGGNQDEAPDVRG